MHEPEKVQLDRYEYILFQNHSTLSYFVTCHDLVRSQHRLTHGPFSLEQAHAFIEARVKRYEDLKRS